LALVAELPVLLIVVLTVIPVLAVPVVADTVLSTTEPPEIPPLSEPLGAV
jgi:hypothetical protein